MERFAWKQPMTSCPLPDMESKFGEAVNMKLPASHTLQLPQKQVTLAFRLWGLGDSLQLHAYSLIYVFRDQRFVSVTFINWIRRRDLNLFGDFFFRVLFLVVDDQFGHFEVCR